MPLLVSAPTPRPSPTKTVASPSRNGTVARSTLVAARRSPSRSASTAAIAARYVGRSGRTHGATTDASPSRKNFGSSVTRRSGPAPRRRAGRAPGRAAGRAPAASAATARPPRRGRARARTAPPIDEPRASTGRACRRGSAGPNCATSFALISLFVSPASDAHRDVGLDPLRQGRVGHVERLLALGAHDLALELRQGRVLLARDRRAREQQRGERDDKQAPRHD